MISDYATLKAAIASWLLRSNLTAEIPTFIQLAEAKMNRDQRLRTLESQDFVTLPTVAGEYAVEVPADFHSVITLDINSVGLGWPPLEYVTPTEFRRKQRENNFASGVPQYYTIAQREFRLVPTPDSDYELDLVFETRLPSLSDDNTENWLLADSPDLYLYAALAESAPFLDRDERIPVWEGGYNSRAENFKLDADAKRYNGPPLKARASRTIG